MFTATQQSLVRRLNDEMICQNLRLHGPLTRADLARIGDLTVPAVLKMTNRLMEAGLVVEGGRADSRSRGPKAQLFQLSDSFGTITTVSVLRTELVLARWNLSGEVIERRRIPFDATGDIAHQVLAATAGAPCEPHVIVIGLPGAVDPETGDVLAATELDHWQPGTAARITNGTEATVVFDNEVNFRADAEYAAGQAQGVPDFLLLSLGQGIGAAAMLGGKSLRGANGAAGEVGVMYVGGPEHPKMQDMAGGWRLAAVVGDRHDISYAWVHRLVENCPPDAPEWRILAEQVAPGLVSMTTVLDPPLVVLGGEISRIAGEPLRAAIEAEVTRLLPWPAPTIRTSSAGDEAVLLGAHYRGWDALVTEVLGGAH